MRGFGTGSLTWHARNHAWQIIARRDRFPWHGMRTPAGAIERIAAAVAAPRRSLCGHHVDAAFALGLQIGRIGNAVGEFGRFAEKLERLKPATRDMIERLVDHQLQMQGKAE